jgi:hypothetical protein
LPTHVNWSEVEKEYNLKDTQQRALLYETVLREGEPEDFTEYVDGALLCDMWSSLVLPQAVKQAWNPVIEKAFCA